MTATVVDAPRRVEPPVRLPESPYKGLSYYSAVDAPFFFGRERETEIVIANLMASRLTLLYGESGVGKSSLLRAGVGRQLNDRARENVERGRRAQFVVAHFPSDDDAEGVRTSWRDDPIAGISKSIERAVESLELEIEPPSAELGFTELLAKWTERLESDVLVILDQFEEYLLYHEGDDAEGTLAAELPRALARPDLRASFLISIREDSVAKLDRFKGRIPTLFDNYLRIRHLDREGAYDAIVKPVAKYNELAKVEPEMTIEPQLIETLLKELETGRVVIGVVGVGVSDAHDHHDGDDGDGEQRIDTPYLQLVMTRLWKEEQRTGSHQLRLATLDRLGHCERIVKTHLDGTMKTLRPYSRYVAARVFHHLVTPSGTKIAHRAGDLAAYVGLAESDVEPVLNRLTGGDYRILRQVGGREGDSGPARYEIFHDVLAAAILDWRVRYLRAREFVQAIRRGVTGLAHAAVGIYCLSLLYDEVFPDYYYYGGEERRVLYIVWAATALVMWASTTVVLVRRWRRRTAWVVPLVGAVASALGPVTASILAVNLGIRLWSWTARRFGAGSRKKASSAPRRAGRARNRFRRQWSTRLYGIASIAGGALIMTACFLPSVEFELDRTAESHALVALDWRLWFALAPLVGAAAIALMGLVLLVRSRGRRFSSGLLAGLAIGVFAYFVAYLFWPEAIQAALMPHQFVWWVTPRVGAFLGAAGAALILVSAAPPSVGEISLAVLGARRRADRVMDDLRRSMADQETAWPRRATAAGVAASTGAVLVVAGCFVRSEAWYGDHSASLASTSAWAAAQALTPGLAAGVVGILVVRRIGDPRVCSGLLVGAGLACLALFTGLLGSAYADGGGAAGAGAYIGIAGSLLMLGSGPALLRRERVARSSPSAVARATA